MKKIISALAVSALVLGSAAAKTSVNLNYRNGAYLFGYTNNGDKDAAKKTSVVFDSLSKYQGGQDSMTFKASGDILDFEANIQPKVDDTIRFNVLKIGAKWGSFHVQSGWNGDGINGGYRVTNDAANVEGLLFETAKLGSMFDGSYSLYADNQIEIGNNRIFTNRIMYAQADYTLGFSDIKINFKGTVISDRGWNNEADNAIAGEYNGGNKGWSVFVDVSKGKMFKGEAFLKGTATTYNGDDKTVLVPGLYFQWLGTPNLIATVGGAMTVFDGDLSDYSFDLRARYAVNSALAITYYLKYSALDEDNYMGFDKKGNVSQSKTAAIVKNVGYNGTAFSAQAVLWNFVNVRYAVTPNLIANVALGALSDVGNLDNASNGTTISIHPNAQIFAGKGASITVGVAASFQGIGSEKASSYKNSKNDDGTTQIGIAIPLLFRVTM